MQLYYNIVHRLCGRFEVKKFIKETKLEVYFCCNSAGCRNKYIYLHLHNTFEKKIRAVTF